MKYKHLLITRFNIRIDRDTEYTLGENWMRTRLSLFEQYCLPSVMAQTCQDFVWLILMDSNTDAVSRQRMAQYAQLCPMMHITYVHPTADLTTFYCNLIQPYTLDVNYLITTRLDNDDMLSNTYMAEIQKQLSAVTIFPHVISFVHGVQLFMNDKVALSMQWRNNHFVSLVEDTDTDCYSVLNYDHIYIEKCMAVQTIRTSAPAWGEVVHNCNVTNDYTPNIKATPFYGDCLPFSGDWSDYMRGYHNSIYRLRYYLRYRLRTLRKLCARVFRACGLN